MTNYSGVSCDFARRWNYYNCGGALDGKYVAIKKSSCSGSVFFNYKKFQNVILVALSDANYQFLYVDVGAEGGAGNAGTWARCKLSQLSMMNALPSQTHRNYQTMT